MVEASSQQAAELEQIEGDGACVGAGNVCGKAELRDRPDAAAPVVEIRILNDQFQRDRLAVCSRGRANGGQRKKGVSALVVRRGGLARRADYAIGQNLLAVHPDSIRRVNAGDSQAIHLIGRNEAREQARIAAEIEALRALPAAKKEEPDQ